MRRRPATPYAERIRARVEAGPREGEWHVLVFVCASCGARVEASTRTESATTADDCRAAAHTWRHIGTRLVVGSKPWLGRVPGMLGPGRFALERGTVFVGTRRVEVDAPGVFEVTNDLELRARSERAHAALDEG